MGKFSFGNGQYVVYATTRQEAQKIIIQELQRFDNIKGKIFDLLSSDGAAFQNFLENSSEENLNIHFNSETSLIFDEPDNATTKGEVRQRTLQNGKFSYDLAYRYPSISGHNANFRLAHEMGHLVLNPANVARQTLDRETNSRQVAGILRRTEDGQFYGFEMQENAINLIAELAIRGENTADDIMMGNANVSEFNLYKKCDELIKLLAVSMRNDFNKEITFEQLVNQKLDSMIELPDGTKEPANIFFYGMLTDSSIIEKEFDKYMGDDAWKQLNDAITQLHHLSPDSTRFNKIFEIAQGMIVDFANFRMQTKYKETIEREGGAPELNNKINIINHMIGVEQVRTHQQVDTIELPKGYQINEFGEIIRPDNVQSQTSNNSPANDTSLSLIQKIAQMLKKNDMLMNISFVENFVNRQLNLLPPVSKHAIGNLPSQSRMSNPQKLEYMRAKMERDQYNTLLTGIRGFGDENEYATRCQEAEREWEQQKQMATTREVGRDVEGTISR